METFGYSCGIAWGDGESDTISSFDDSALTHFYADQDDFTITITGLCETFRIEDSRLIECQQYGDTGLTSTENMFKNCDACIFTAPPAINTSMVTNMNGMFWGCVVGNPDVSEFDTSLVQSFNQMFFNTDVAVPDVSGFNMGSCLSIQGMFDNAIIAEPDVSQWDMGNCQDFSFAFFVASAADPDVSMWNMSSAVTIASMFVAAVSAAPDISSWAIGSSLVTMELAFASSGLTGSPDVSSWDTSNVTSMEGTFRFCSAADIDVGAWNIGSLITAEEMFDGSGLSNTNYDSLLNGWAGQEPNILDNGLLHGGSAAYSAGGARAVLTGHSWVITDGGAA